MATSTIPSLYNKETVALDCELANTNVMSLQAGQALGILLNPTTIVCFLYMRFITTATRSADFGVFRLKYRNKLILPNEPYMIPCSLNYDYPDLAPGNMKDGVAYFRNPRQWDANTTAAFSGVFIGTFIQ